MNENKISQSREPASAPVQCGLRKTDASRGQIAPPNCLSVVTIECLERFVAGKSSATPGIQKIMPGEQQSCNGGTPNPRRRILVVEDDPDIRRINAMVLHRAGYHVDTAEDGDYAWEALGASHYDLMITDNNMPNLTGMQLLRRLHATRRVLPFIMATGKMPEEEFTQCPWLQPAAKLLKPYTAEELLGVVEKCPARIRWLCGTSSSVVETRFKRQRNLRRPENLPVSVSSMPNKFAPPHSLGGG